MVIAVFAAAVPDRLRTAHGSEPVAGAPTVPPHSPSDSTDAEQTAVTLDLTPDELLTTTRAVRKRLDLTRPVPRDLIEECVDLAVQAPTGRNRQRWHFMVVTETEQRRAVADIFLRALAAAGGQPLTERDAWRMNYHSGSTERVFDGLRSPGRQHPPGARVRHTRRGGTHRPRPGGRAGGDVGVDPAGRVELHAGRPGAWPGHGMDDRAGRRWNASWPRCSACRTRRSCWPPSSRWPSP